MPPDGDIPGGVAAVVAVPRVKLTGDKRRAKVGAAPAICVALVQAAMTGGGFRIGEC
jgi:hypothetical protein